MSVENLKELYKESPELFEKQYFPSELGMKCFMLLKEPNFEINKGSFHFAGFEVDDD